MEKIYKRVPFDIELAKDIQSGKVKGSIVTTEGNSVRIICFDRKGFADKIIGLVAIDAQSEYGYELEISYCEDGSSSKQSRHDLVIELHEETSKHELETFHTDLPKGHAEFKGNATALVTDKALKHEFKPFEKVLVRDIDSFWSAAYYSHYEKEEDKHSCGGVLFDECIPYEGNEYLVGTTNKPKEL